MPVGRSVANGARTQINIERGEWIPAPGGDALTSNDCVTRTTGLTHIYQDRLHSYSIWDLDERIFQALPKNSRKLA